MSVVMEVLCIRWNGSLVRVAGGQEVGKGKELEFCQRQIHLYCNSKIVSVG